MKIGSPVERFNEEFQSKNLHPYLSIGDFSKARLNLDGTPIVMNCYCIVCLDSGFGQIFRGKTVIKYKSNSIVTYKPGDRMIVDFVPGVVPKGKVLLFTPEFIENTSLKKDFFMFNFFDYDASEALELNESEKVQIDMFFAYIEHELNAEDDDMKTYLLRLGVAALLAMCKRFYERQFDTTKLKTSPFMLKLNEILDDYYSPGSTMPSSYGYPTVAWCAEQFDLAPSVFGNMVRRQASVSAQDYIHDRIIERAKYQLSKTDISIESLAKALGFTYPNHFTRFFKKETGMSPMQFRRMS